MSDLPASLRRRLDLLPGWLQDHLQRVRDVAGPLAACHGVDRHAVELGATAHDLARAMGGEELLAEADRLGLEVVDLERRAPILLHGAVAAAWIERDGEIDDSRVVEAVRFHTTGSPGMGPVAQVVFVADKIEPEKVGRNHRLEAVAALATKDLRAAMLEFIEMQVELRFGRGEAVHPRFVALRDTLVDGHLPA